MSYLDAPQTRQKDLGDVFTILRRYEESGERRFSDEMLDSGIQYDEAGAYLLGRDLKSLVLPPMNKRPSLVSWLV
ncbi:MAG: hypothetical protein ACRD2X_08995 [Vicinamibacteraceae bacterium]